jgi:hypothetical protein
MKRCPSGHLFYNCYFLPFGFAFVAPAVVFFVASGADFFAVAFVAILVKFI